MIFYTIKTSINILQSTCTPIWFLDTGWELHARLLYYIISYINKTHHNENLVYLKAKIQIKLHQRLITASKWNSH
jgi:hypothetical protein